MAYEEILRRLEARQAALAEEARMVRTGLKARPDFSAVHEASAGLFAQETIMEVRELIERAPQPKKREQMERALFALLEGAVSEEAFPIEERLRTETDALETDWEGGKIAYADLPARIGAEPSYEKRDALYRLQADLAERLTPLRLDLEHATRQKLASFGFRTEREYCETKKRLRYDLFLAKALPILEETTGLYRRVMSDAMRRAYGKDLGEIGAAHALHWRAGWEFDRLFPSEKIAALGTDAFATIGLQIRRGDGGQRVVAGECQVPGPQSGYRNLRAFLHENVHAAHADETDPSLPYEWRDLPRSEALAEAFAVLVEQLPQNPLWLEHVMHVPKGAAERLSAWSLLDDLYALRRRMATLSCGLAIDEKPYDAGRNSGLYAATLKDLTGFADEPEFWLEDRAPGFRDADELRGWIASAQIEEHLIRRFGDRWFLKRETGPFLKSLFAKGCSWSVEELVQSLGMTAWDPLPLIRKFDGVSKLLR